MRGNEIISLLQRSKEENRLHHAYAFNGPDSPEKWQVVLEFLLQYSTKKPSASLLQEGQHPDLFSIAPVEGALSVDQIRELPKLLSYPPLELWKRFVVFPDASLLNVQSSNALLKILEEPPSHTIFFLFVREMNQLLPTIQSRVQQIRFSPMTNDQILNIADTASLGMPELFFGFAEGSYQKAKLAFDQPEVLDSLDIACDQLIRLWEGSPRVGSEQVKWLEGLDQESAADLAVEAWLLTLRDFSFLCSGASTDAIYLKKYEERLKSLKEKAGKSVLKEIGEKTAKINRYRVYRDFHGNLKLDLLALFVDLQLASVGKL